MTDSRTRLSEQVADEVRAFFGDLVLATEIPRSVRLSEAPGHGNPVCPTTSAQPAHRPIGRQRWSTPGARST